MIKLYDRNKQGNSAPMGQRRLKCRSGGWALMGLTAALLAACGGGGGDSGAPLNPPTAKLQLTPNLKGLSLSVGNFDTSMRVQGGQPPFFALSSGGHVAVALINAGQNGSNDSATIFLMGMRSTNSSQDSQTCGATDANASNANCPDTVSIQDYSYNQASVSFTVDVSLDTNFYGKDYYIGPISIAEGTSQPVDIDLGTTVDQYASLTLPTSVGVPAVATNKLISAKLIPKVVQDKETTILELQLLASCIKSDKAIPIVITDGYGLSMPEMVYIYNSNLANDATSGCL